MVDRLKGLLVIAGCCAALVATPAVAAEWRHGLSYFGDLKYPADFTHFDYVNPAAPKAGELRLAQLGNFYSLNPVIRKGRKVAGFIYGGVLLTYERLMYPADDEPSTHYGWVAESVRLAEDFSEVSFRLRKAARWHDGKPITAADIVYTFEQIKAHGSPTLKLEFRQVTGVTVVNEREVRFEMEGATSPKTAQSIAVMPILPAHWWASREFNVTTIEAPLGSGPYRVVSVDPGRRIVFEHVDDWWGRDVPVNRGRYNIRRVVYDYFKDMNVILEATKAGEIDALLETQAKRWVTQYDFPGFREGHYLKTLLTTRRPMGMSLAVVWNLRQARFQDVRVREALALAYDFEWLNAALMFDFYNRTDSYFSNSELAATGLPSAAELRLLEPHRAVLPKRLFTEPFVLPVTAGSGYPRKNLLRAQQLLADAGYTMVAGQLTDPATGTPFEFEILTQAAALERVAQPYMKNLQRLGITARVRLVEVSQYIHRVGAFDFDATIRTWAQGAIPGPELRNYWSSEAADRDYSGNSAGIRNPVVDELIETVLAARSWDDLVAAARALDRVLLWHHYVVPGFYEPGYRYGFWNKYVRPEIQATYRTGFYDTWWYDASKARTVDAFLDRRGGEAPLEPAR